MLPALSVIALDGGQAVPFAATAALAEADEGAVQAAVDGCLTLIERRDGDAWTPVGQDASSLPLSDTLRLVSCVVAVNFAPYFDVERPTFRPAGGRRTDFDPVMLPNDMDWFWRPMMRGLCRYESLVDGTMHIEDVATMNAVLDAADENQHRAVKAAEKAKA